MRGVFQLRQALRFTLTRFYSSNGTTTSTPEQIAFLTTNPSTLEISYMADDDQETSGAVKAVDSVYMYNPFPDVLHMVDRDKVAIQQQQIKLAIHYPLRGEYVFQLYADAEAGFTNGELAMKVSRVYQDVYLAEASTAPDPGRMHPLMNRARSDGKYGIWGHDLGDLTLHGICYEPEKDAYTPLISS